MSEGDPEAVMGRRCRLALVADPLRATRPLPFGGVRGLRAGGSRSRQRMCRGETCPQGPLGVAVCVVIH